VFKKSLFQPEPVAFYDGYHPVYPEEGEDKTQDIRKDIDGEVC